MTEIMKYIDTVIRGNNLTQEESSRAFQIVLLGGATPAQMAALLVALRMKGETVEELTGAALTLRAKSGKISSPAHALDTCGTGGDMSSTFNISTAVSFVVAACDVPVAKHGNRAVSSQSGSADILQYLGVNIDAEIPVVEQSLQEVGICFMMAPKFHLAMRHVAPVRKELKVRTIFNLLGPLSNPASTEYQLLGVYDNKWVVKLAEVLKRLGSRRAWVVHGSDGLDELTTTGASFVAELSEGEVRTFEILPEDVGLARAKPEDLYGGDVIYNARELRNVLRGEQGSHRDIVLLNAAASLLVAEKVPDLISGIAMASEAIDTGKAQEKLARLVEVTNRD